MREKPVTELEKSTLELAYIEHLRWLRHNVVTAPREVFDPRMKRAGILSSELRRRGIDTGKVERVNFARLYS